MDDHDADLTAVFGEHLLRQDARPTGTSFHRNSIPRRRSASRDSEPLQKVHPWRIFLQRLPGFLEIVFPRPPRPRPLLGDRREQEIPLSWIMMNAVLNRK